MTTAEKKAILFISTSAGERDSDIGAKEFRDLQETRDRSHGRDQIHVSPVLRATLEDIPREFRRAKLAHPLAIVHVTGSGVVDGSWQMPKNGGGQEFVDPVGLAQLIAELDTANTLQLIVFNGSYSDVIARLFAPSNSNIVGWARQAAIKSHNDYAETVAASLAFTSQLYAALFDHESIMTSFMQAKRYLKAKFPGLKPKAYINSYSAISPDDLVPFPNY